MSFKQDLAGARTAADIERRYNFTKRFAEVIGVADDARKAAEDAAGAVDNLKQSLTSEEIFNLLTNNGEVEGIYRDDGGNVYINASYIVSGILRSKDGSTFYLDLDNGILKGKFEEFSIGGKTVDGIAQEKADSAESNAKAYADGAAAGAVNAQTQADIFNKLTENGALKGIYMENGELYINASYLKSGTIDADLIKTGAMTSQDGSLKFDLISNKIEIGEGTGPRPAWDGKIVLDAFGVSGYGKNEVSNKFEKTINVFPGFRSSEDSVSMSGITALSGVGLSIFTDGGTLSLGSFFGETEISGSTIKINGKAVSWKDNGDGTYSLVGRD